MEEGLVDSGKRTSRDSHLTNSYMDAEDSRQRAYLDRLSFLSMYVCVLPSALVSFNNRVNGLTKIIVSQ